MRQTNKKFTSSGSWTCPAGITTLMLMGMGGGGGGAGSDVFSSGGAGGCGSGFKMEFIDVVPNTTYTITIGNGGTGGTGSFSPTDGGDGGDTTFGAVATFKGSPGGKAQGSEQGSAGFGDPDGSYYPKNEGGISMAACNGGVSKGSGRSGSINGFITGDSGAAIFGTISGGGGAGGRGNGANGGNNGGGDSAAANTGAGGGGGNTTTNFTASNGGAGGSGYLEIIWLE